MTGDRILTLNDLKPEQTATVVQLLNTGTTRRRMLDLGILPGTKITVEVISPFGDPVAYRVRGAVIALRREQAAEIQITVDHPEVQQ
jgi:Fe2+ transport system protein FeoA